MIRTNVANPLGRKTENRQELKIARIQAQAQMLQDGLELARVMAPAIELVAGALIITNVQSHGGFGKGFDANPLLIALYGIVGIQALSPIIPELAHSGSSVVTDIAKALPALAIGGAALGGL